MIVGVYHFVSLDVLAWVALTAIAVHVVNKIVDKFIK